MRSVTDDKKGNNPTSVLSVDIEEALKAGHSVEPVNEMQLCAIAVGRLLASSAHIVAGVLMCEVFRRFVGRGGRSRHRPAIVSCCGEVDAKFG